MLIWAVRNAQAAAARTTQIGGLRLCPVISARSVAYWPSVGSRYLAVSGQFLLARQHINDWRTEYARKEGSKVPALAGGLSWSGVAVLDGGLERGRVGVYPGCFVVRVDGTVGADRGTIGVDLREVGQTMRAHAYGEGEGLLRRLSLLSANRARAARTSGTPSGPH